MYNNIVYIGIAGRRDAHKDKEGKKCIVNKHTLSQEWKSQNNEIDRI